MLSNCLQMTRFSRVWTSMGRFWPLGDNFKLLGFGFVFSPLGVDFGPLGVDFLSQEVDDTPLGLEPKFDSQTPEPTNRHLESPLRG